MIISCNFEADIIDDAYSNSTKFVLVIDSGEHTEISLYLEMSENRKLPSVWLMLDDLMRVRLHGGTDRLVKPERLPGTVPKPATSLPLHGNFEIYHRCWKNDPTNLKVIMFLIYHRYSRIFEHIIFRSEVQVLKSAWAALHNITLFAYAQKADRLTSDRVFVLWMNS